jgi:hypothetical protein
MSTRVRSFVDFIAESFGRSAGGVAAKQGA